MNDQIEQAEALKKEGNQFFKSQKYSEASKAYTKAIETHPKAVYYTNRSATHAKLGNWDLALEDSLTAININPNFSRGYEKSILYLIRSGRIQKAREYIDSGSEKFPESSFFPKKYDVLAGIETKIEVLKENYQNADYQACLEVVDQLAQNCIWDVSLISQKIQFLGFLNRLPEAQECVTQNEKILKKHSEANFFIIKSQISRFEMDFPKSREYLIISQKLSPENQETPKILKNLDSLERKLARADKRKNKQKFKSAIGSYKKVMELDPMNRRLKANLWHKIGLCGLQIGNLWEAWEAFNESAWNEAGWEAFFEKGKIEESCGKYKSALNSFRISKALGSDSEKIDEMIEKLENLETHEELGD